MLPPTSPTRTFSPHTPELGSPAWTNQRRVLWPAADQSQLTWVSSICSQTIMVLSMLAVRRLAWPGHHCTLYTCTLLSAQPGLVLSTQYRAQHSV